MGDPPTFALLERDGVSLSLVLVEQARPEEFACCYCYVDELDDAYAHCVDSKVDLVQELTAHPWGTRDFVVRDPDGHRLAVGNKTTDRQGAAELTREALVHFLRQHRWAVQASVSATGAPQAAVIGFAVTDELEIVFDTVDTTRKHDNLRSNPRIALVVGWDDAITAQLEGDADFPQGPELERIRDCYFEAFPDGRERLTWAGITHVRVRVRWARYSDFNANPPRIIELDL